MLVWSCTFGSSILGTRLHSGPFQTTLNSGPTHFCKHLRGRWCGRSIGLYIYCSTVLYQPPLIYLVSATSHNRVYRPCSSARSTSSRAGYLDIWPISPISCLIEPELNLQSYPCFHFWDQVILRFNIQQETTWGQPKHVQIEAKRKSGILNVKPCNWLLCKSSMYASCIL